MIDRLPTILFGIVSLIFLVALLGCDQVQDRSTGFDRELVFEAKFSEASSSLDTTVWTFDLGDGCDIHPDLCGWGNQELQVYTKDEANVRIEDGHLIIEAHQGTIENTGFTSARIKTRDSWRYGRIEVRAKLPFGRGTWPGIWMLPTIKDRERQWPVDGEIDIVEHVGFEMGIVHGTIHTEAYNGMMGTQKTGKVRISDPHSNFYVYAIDWTAEEIVWSVDDTEYHSFKKHGGREQWPFDRTFHLILNLAVGGTWGGRDGVDPDIWPQQLVVDWIRVYQDPN